MAQGEQREAAQKLYTVQYDDCCNFVAGAVPDGEQVLMGVIGEAPFYVVAAFFDKAGCFLREESRSVAFTKNPAQTHAENHDEKVKSLWRVLEQWKSSIGLRPGEIKIAEFHLPEWDYFGTGIGISDLPQHLQSFADDPSWVEDEAERRGLFNDIEEFRRDGRYVLCWGTDYWMNKVGEITDT